MSRRDIKFAEIISSRTRSRENVIFLTSLLIVAATSRMSAIARFFASAGDYDVSKCFPPSPPFLTIIIVNRISRLYRRARSSCRVGRQTTCIHNIMFRRAMFTAKNKSTRYCASREMWLIRQHNAHALSRAQRWQADDLWNDITVLSIAMRRVQSVAGNIELCMNKWRYVRIIKYVHSLLHHRAT